MKNVFLTATAFATLLLGLNACSKKSDTDNNSQTQLSATQMLLLGTTNPNNVNASAIWELDSSYRYNTQTVDTLDHGWFLFTVDSMINCSSDASILYFGHPYSISNDSMYVPEGFFATLTISSTNFIADMGEIKHYFTKLN